ncbi:c-type cytochrome [Novosphingobium aquimarinum]|uniref:c-type cytochrome n=1 Tax=Novosphingobium aquimarinum TaxID=2682494 RepID=UPI0012ECA215|nr:cytochrome c [Novosphingobium aquimarinum]
MPKTSSDRALRLAIAAAAGLAVAGVTTFALAAPSASAVIAERQANYKKMGAAMKAIKDQLAGTPQKGAVVDAAQTLATIARKQTGLFPAGSGASSGVKTDALANIWSDRATFDGYQKDLIAQTGKLLAAANTGSISATTERYRATGKVCSACHKEFRAD